MFDIKIAEYLKDHNIIDKEIVDFEIDNFFFSDGIFYMRVNCQSYDKYNERMWFSIDVPLGKVTYENN